MYRVCLSSIRLSSSYCILKRVVPGRRHFSVLRGRSPVDLSLYLVTNRAYTDNDAHFIDKVMQAVEGGVACVQYSDPHANLRAKFQIAQSLKEKLDSRGVPLIINNHIDLALAIRADGVHLGQRDLNCTQARQLLGSRAIIGLTVETWEDVLCAEELDVDYLGVQIFPSKHTKPDSTALWGLEGLRKIRAVSRHRLVAIGGIHLDNLACVYQELNRDDGIAMVGQLWRTHDPKRVAKKAADLFYQFSSNQQRAHALS